MSTKTEALSLREPKRIDRQEPDYMVVESPTPALLRESVKHWLLQGYRCQGGCTIRTADGFHLQAMVKQ